MSENSNHLVEKYITMRTKMKNVLPTVHDEKLERELAAELGAR